MPITAAMPGARGSGLHAAFPAIQSTGGRQMQASCAERSSSGLAPLARAAGEIGNANWGPLLRAGNDKSLFARQIERHADLYMSRVSNLLAETPYGYLRADRGRLPHDPS